MWTHNPTQVTGSVLQSGIKPGTLNQATYFWLYEYMGLINELTESESTKAF